MKSFAAKSLLWAAACLPALLFAAPEGHAAAKAKPLIAISPISLSDTSGTPLAATNALWSRVRSLTAGIGTGLAGSGVYDAKLVAKASCDDAGGDCLAKWAHGTGGNLIMMGTVLKMTPTISHFWVGIFRSDASTRIFYSDIVINGDGAEAWKRAGDSLIAEIVKARPGL